MPNRFVLLILTALLLAVACSDDEATKPSEPQTQLPYLFPDDIGDWWSYEVLHDEGVDIETVHVEIVASDTLNDGRPVLVQVAQHRDTVDTTFIHIVKGSGTGLGRDTVAIYHDRNCSSIEMVYLLPLDTGMAWPGVNEVDTVRVVEKRSIAFPVGTYVAYRLDNGWNQFEWFYHGERWVVPYVGLVSLHHSWLAGIETGEENWEILDWAPDGMAP